jgi:hypothetical protein
VMTRKNSVGLGRRIWVMFQRGMLGTAMLSKAAGAVVAPVLPQQAHDAWSAVSRELQSETAQGDLPPEVVDVLFRAIKGSTDTVATMRKSYLTIPEAMWPALDRFWMSRPEVLTSPAVYRNYVAMRSALSGGMPSGPVIETLQGWIHKAHHRPGHYDNGGGNGGNTKG